MAAGLEVSLDKPLEWVVGFAPGNTELSLEHWTLIPRIVGLDDERYSGSSPLEIFPDRYRYRPMCKNGTLATMRMKIRIRAWSRVILFGVVASVVCVDVVQKPRPVVICFFHHWRDVGVDQQC